VTASKNIEAYLSRFESSLESNSKSTILKSVKDLKNILRDAKNEKDITKKRIAEKVSRFLFNLIAEEPTQISMISEEYLGLVELCLELDPENILAGFAKLAYLSAVDPEKAKKWAFSIKELIYTLENTPQKVLYLEVLATRLVSLGLLTDAVALCKDAIDICFQLNNEKEKLRAISKYIETLADAQIYMDCDEFIKIAEKLAQKYKGYLGMRFYRTYSYYMLRVKQDLNTAWKFLGKAEALCKNATQLEEIEFAYVLYTKSLIYMRKGLFDESITTLKMALGILEKNEWRHRPVVSNITLGVISMLTGDYDTAEHYFNRYIDSKGIYITPLDNLIYYVYSSILSILKQDYEAFNKNIVLLKKYHIILRNQMKQMNLHIHNKVCLLFEISEYIFNKETLTELCKSIHPKLSSMLHKKTKIGERTDAVYDMLKYVESKLLYPLSNGNYSEFIKNIKTCKKEFLFKLEETKESEQIKKNILKHILSILNEMSKNPHEPSNILSLLGIIITIV